MGRSNKNHDANRETLIKIAFDLFLDNGYEKTTISQIMKAANLSKGGMYHYFSSKDEILDAVIQFGLNQEIEKIKARIKGMAIDEKLIGLTQNVEISDFTRKLLGYTNDNADSIVAYKVRECNLYLSIPVLSEIIQEGVDGGIYNTAYPKETAEFCALMIRGLSDTNILPITDEKGHMRRLETFFNIVIACLKPSDEHAEKLKQILTGDVQKAMPNKTDRGISNV